MSYSHNHGVPSSVLQIRFSEIGRSIYDTEQKIRTVDEDLLRPALSCVLRSFLTGGGFKNPIQVGQEAQHIHLGL